MLPNKYEVILNEDEINHFMYLSYMIDGMGIIVSCISKAENYIEELFQNNKKELLEYTIERNLLVMELIKKYIPNEQKDLIWNLSVDPDMKKMIFTNKTNEKTCDC